MMRRLITTRVIAISASIVFSAATSIAASRDNPANVGTIPMFKKGDRIAFVGNSITHGGHYHSYIWLYYMTRFPDMPIYIYNRGVGGDTSSNIYDRWDLDVMSAKPDYLTLTFGMNDTGYWDVYNTPDADSLAAVKVTASLSKYAEIVEKIEAMPGNPEIVMIGGSPYDETSRFNTNILHGKNAAIQEIAEAQKDTAEAHGWGFVDFNAPMVHLADSLQQIDTSYSFCPADRVHPDKDGQMVMAWLFLKAQGLSGKKVADIEIEATSARALKAENCRISKVCSENGTLSFDYLAQSLPYPCDSVSEHGWGNIHSQRDAMKIIPFTKDFNEELLTVQGLKTGNYDLTIDGEPIARLSSGELSEGVNLASYTNTPQYRQASEIMYLNEERFEIEKRLREYIWIEYNTFNGTDLLFADNWQSLQKVNDQAKKDWFTAASNYWYKKSYYPGIRETWTDYMDYIVSRIYKINKPVTHRIVLEKVDNH